MAIRSWDVLYSRILFVSSLLISFENFVEIEVSSVIWDSNKGLPDIITLQFPKASSEFFHKPVGHIKSCICCILISHPISAIRVV